MIPEDIAFGFFHGPNIGWNKVGRSKTWTNFSGPGIPGSRLIESVNTNLRETLQDTEQFGRNYVDQLDDHRIVNQLMLLTIRTVNSGYGKGVCCSLLRNYRYFELKFDDRGRFCSAVVFHVTEMPASILREQVPTPAVTDHESCDGPSIERPPWTRIVTIDSLWKCK